jgi:magnesium-transporting ATPase (P-type)
VLTGNPSLWVSAGALIALQVVFTYAPFMNAWFGSAPIGLHSWLLTAGIAVVVFVVIEAAKAVLRATRPVPGRSSAPTGVAG